MGKIAAIQLEIINEDLDSRSQKLDEAGKLSRDYFTGYAQLPPEKLIIYLQIIEKILLQIQE